MRKQDASIVEQAYRAMRVLDRAMDEHGVRHGVVMCATCWTLNELAEIFGMGTRITARTWRR